MQLSATSECSCLISLGNTINEATSDTISQLVPLIQQQLGDGLVDIVPSYSSILLNLNTSIMSVEHCCRLLAPLLEQVRERKSVRAQRCFDIPTYYGEEVSWDIADVSQRTGLTADEIIQLHSARRYRVYAIGFAPGFCFLGRLDERLQLPRKATPRERVPPGSVAIAELQTAVYPCTTPGGWHLIGRSPQDMLSLCSDKQNPLRVGDEVRFVAVNRQQYLARGGTLS